MLRNTVSLSLFSLSLSPASSKLETMYRDIGGLYISYMLYLLIEIVVCRETWPTVRVTKQDAFLSRNMVRISVEYAICRVHV